MRLKARFAIVLLALFALLLPVVSSGEQLQTLMEKDVPVGTTTITFWGQTFRIQTTVPLHVALGVKSPTRIKMSFRVASSGAGAMPSSASSGEEVVIYWVDWETNIYLGPPPDEEWSEILLTESGFTEK